MREIPPMGFPQISFEAIGGLWKQIVERNCGKFHDTCLFMLFGVYAGIISNPQTFSMPFLHPFRMSRLLEGYFLEW